MKKIKILVLIFILICIIFSNTIIYAQLPFPYSNQKNLKERKDIQKLDYPAELNLNSQYIFDKDKIQEWVKYNSWEKAYEISLEQHTINYKKTYGNAVDVTLIIPVLSWVKENYIGSIQEYDQNQIKKNYYNHTFPLELRTKFIVRITSTDQADINIKNYSFQIVDKDERIWELDNDNISVINSLQREFMGMKLNDIILEIEFNFYDKKKIPNFNNDIKLHILNKRKNEKDKFIWQLGSRDNESFSKQILIEELIEGYLKLNPKKIIKFSNKVNDWNFKQKVDKFVTYLKKEDERQLAVMFENVFSRELLIYPQKVQKALLKKILDPLKTNEIKKLLDIWSETRK